MTGDSVSVLVRHLLCFVSDIPQVPLLRSVIAQITDLVSGYFLNRSPICPGDTCHYRDTRRLLLAATINIFRYCRLNILSQSLDKKSIVIYNNNYTDM